MLCISGPYRAWLFTCWIDAQRSRRAARSNRLSWLFSAANDFTTRVPVTFSSTIVAMSAVRAIIINAIGNSFLRMLKPVKNTKGSVISADRGEQRIHLHHQRERGDEAQHRHRDHRRRSRASSGWRGCRSWPAR